MRWTPVVLAPVPLRSAFSVKKVLQNRNVGAEYDSKLQFGEAKFVLHSQICDSLFRKFSRLF